MCRQTRKQGGGEEKGRGKTPTPRKVKYLGVNGHFRKVFSSRYPEVDQDTFHKKGFQKRTYHIFKHGTVPPGKPSS
jgi:hypothetical protein